MEVKRITEIGAYLDAEHLGDVLLPKQFVSTTCKSGELLEVFLFKDAESQLTASRKIPLVQLDQCAYLKVVSVNRIGAFLDWGLSKDLFVPIKQQRTPMQVGKSYVVTVYLDEWTQRLAASSKLDEYLNEYSTEFKTGQAVDLIIFGQSELGFKATINHTHLGLIFTSDVFQSLEVGQKIKGFIKNLRHDYKIDLTLQKPGKQLRDNLQIRILDHLAAQGGHSDITDKSPPEKIYAVFSVSKANYKKALGALYRQRKIILDKQRITLV